MFGPSKSAPRVHAGSHRWFQWEDPGERMRVEISLDVIEEIRAAVASASSGVPERGEEIGGVLFGQRGDPVVIHGFEPLDCEHRRGPSFTLSAKERKALKKRFEKLPAGLDVVGFYRSHTRTGLYLDQEDFSLMQEMFSDPAQVALLVKPWAGHGQIAGFFFWEDGDIYRRATHLQFPFAAAELQKAEEPAAEEEVPAAAAEEVSEAPLPAAARPPLGRVDPLPLRESAPRHSPLDSVAGLFNRPHVRLAALVSCAVVGVVALGLSAVNLIPARQETQPASVTHSGSDVGLNVVKTDGGFHITWNQRSLTLARAGGATLRITDGGAERLIPLDDHQIRTGNITYYAATDAVTIRLDPGRHEKASEATPAPAADTPAPAPQNAQQALPSRPKVKEAPKPFTTAALSRQMDGADRAEELEPPPAIVPSPNVRLDAALIPQKPLPERTKAYVAYEPLGPTGLRKVVSKIPGLGFLGKRKHREGENFQAAKPVRRVAPAIPAEVPAKGLEVELKISIDEFGTVDKAEVVSRGSDGQLEDLAIQSVQSWRFTPARLEEEAVPSEMLLRFDFDPARKTEQASSRP